MRDIIDMLMKWEPSAALPIMAVGSLRGMRILHPADISDLKSCGSRLCF